MPLIVEAFRGERVKVGKEKGIRLNLMLVPTLILSGVSLLIGLWPGIVWPGVQAVVNSFF